MTKSLIIMSGVNLVKFLVFFFSFFFDLQREQVQNLFKTLIVNMNENSQVHRKIIELTISFTFHLLKLLTLNESNSI